MDGSGDSGDTEKMKPNQSHCNFPPMNHNHDHHQDPEAGRDAELSWMAAVAAALLVGIIAVLAAAA